MEEALHICKFFGTKKTFQYKALILSLTTGMCINFQKPI